MDRAGSGCSPAAGSCKLGNEPPCYRKFTNLVTENIGGKKPLHLSNYKFTNLVTENIGGKKPLHLSNYKFTSLVTENIGGKKPLHLSNYKLNPELT